MHHTLLSAQRKTYALSQEDVGLLLGRSADTVAKYEMGVILPPLTTAMRLEFLFGPTISELLPEAFSQTVQATVPAIQRLSILIEGRSDALAVRKRQFIQALGDRLEHLLPRA